MSQLSVLSITHRWLLCVYYLIQSTHVSLFFFSTWKKETFINCLLILSNERWHWISLDTITAWCFSFTNRNRLIQNPEKKTNGTIRLTCTEECCNESVTLYENKIKFMRGIHSHHERILSFHIGEMVHEFQQAATTDLRTSLP
jgi:hypothetical protein